MQWTILITFRRYLDRMITFNPIISINFSIVANLIPVHYGLQNGGEWRHAYSGGNENGMMSSENVAGRCTVGTIDVDGQRLSMAG